jgi:hypothetical protein
VATTTLTAADAALKEVYLPSITDQLENEVKTLRRVEKTAENVTNDSVGGKYVRFATRMKRNHGIGARLENEALPIPRTQQYADGQVKLTNQYGAIELTGQVFELATSNSQAFASILDQEVSGITEGLAKDLNRQVYGQPSGVLATAVTGSTTTLVSTNADVIWLEIGMFVDVWDTSAAGFMAGGPFEITNIQRDTPGAGQATVTITVSGTALAVGDTFHRPGSRNKEQEGFNSIVAASGTIYNINPATFPNWTSEVDSPGAQSITEGRMIAMIDRVNGRGGDTSVIFTAKGVRRAYFALLQQQRQFVNTQKFEGGFTGLAFTTDDGDVPLVSDNDCPNGTMWFINEKRLKLFHAGNWDWMNRDGSRWRLVTDANGDYDAYRARLYRYLQLGTTQRNSHGVIKQIIEA